MTILECDAGDHLIFGRASKSKNRPIVETGRGIRDLPTVGYAWMALSDRQSVGEDRSQALGNSASNPRCVKPDFDDPSPSPQICQQLQAVTTGAAAANRTASMWVAGSQALPDCETMWAIESAGEISAWKTGNKASSAVAALRRLTQRKSQRPI